MVTTHNSITLALCVFRPAGFSEEYVLHTVYVRYLRFYMEEESPGVEIVGRERRKYEKRKEGES